MMITRSSVTALLSLPFFAFSGEDITAESIMSRVAENQTRSVEARARWTHQQELFVRLNRYNGKMAREERKHYIVLPQPKGLKKELVRFEGRYQDHGKIFEYTEPGFERKGMDIDAELVDEFPEELMDSNGSRDGIEPGLFPLTTDKQRAYKFKLHGKEQYRDREVWRVTFEPPSGHYAWAGEALIDTTEYQPVLVTTHFSRKLPLMVRTMLGTDIQHLGFKVEYAKLEDGVWFPSKYSGEFNLKAVFFYRRKIAVSMNNSDFRKWDVQSTIEYALERPTK